MQPVSLPAASMLVDAMMVTPQTSETEPVPVFSSLKEYKINGVTIFVCILLGIHRTLHEIEYKSKNTLS